MSTTRADAARSTTRADARPSAKAGPTDLREIAVVAKEQTQEEQRAQDHDRDPMREDRPRLLAGDPSDLTPEEEHERELAEHESGVDVAEGRPRVRLRHRPVEERVGRLVEVHRDREHRADKDRAGDL